MSFDLLRYYNDNKDYFGDTSLEEVAKEVHSSKYAKDNPDFSSWQKDMGIDSTIQEDIKRRTPPPPPTFAEKLRSAVSHVSPT